MGFGGDGLSRSETPFEFLTNAECILLSFN